VTDEADTPPPDAGMPPRLRPTPEGMKQTAQERLREYGLALPASVVVHVVLVLLLVFGFPLPEFQQPEEEQAVEVELVPPPGEEEQKAEAEQPPPPPPPPEQAEEQPQPPPPPPAEQPAEQAEVQPPPESVLQPVFRFGEEDAGPRQNPGNAAEEGQQAERSEPQQPEKPQEQVEPPPQPDALAANQADQQAAQGEAQEPVIEPPTLPAEDKPEAEEPPAEDAGQIASRVETGVTIATTSMKDLPRGVRAGRLCVTELRERMLNAVPPYYPDLLPSFRLDEGTALATQRAAFRMGGEWYSLAFRCEIDEGATRVRSFAFEVGGKLSPAERQRRGLPVR